MRMRVIDTDAKRSERYRCCERHTTMQCGCKCTPTSVASVIVRVFDEAIKGVAVL